MAQVLPPDETFTAPDWAVNDDGGASNAPPWFYWYVGFDPTNNFAASAADSHTSEPYPMRPGGTMPGTGTSALLRPHPQALTSLPCLMTDTNGPTNDTPLRSVLCREEDAFGVDELNITVVFGMEVSGGATEGFAHSGFNGSSPQPGGRLRYPPSPPPPLATDLVFKGMAPGTRGGWSTGGPMSAMGSDDSPINPWPAWQGNAVYFRAGGGDSYVTNGAVNDTNNVKRLWYYSCVDHYAFFAYPAGGTSTDPDLYVELWAMKYTDQGGTSNQARLLIKQTCVGCVDRIDFRQPFRMRVETDSFSGSPQLQAFIGPYTDINGEIQPEVQCFKTDVLDTTNDYELGANIVHAATTGIVIDTHADKITTYADRTIGWGTATDLLVDVSLALDAAATDPVIWQVHTGVYSVEAKDTPADPDDAEVLYRDEFSRIVESGTSTGNTAIVNPILSSVTGVEGVQLNGLFTFDGFAQQYPVIPSTEDLNLDLIRQLMFWTTPPPTGSTPVIVNPNDYVTLSYEPDNEGINRPYLVTRSFIHLRPSTQQYNHHRKIEFQPGAETGVIDPISYEIGIHLRGYFDGYTTNGLGCWLSFTTNGGDGGTSAITYATVTVGYREHIYSEQNPDNVTGATHVVARKIWAAGAADGFPNLYSPGGSGWNSLDFQATAYAETPSPDTIGLYNVKINGAEVELDDPTAPYQSGISSPYTIVEPAPRVAQGRAEGFWFYASIPEVNVSTRSFHPAILRNWTEEALVTDPGPPVTDADSMASISVAGEGTPFGELNTSTGALAINGEGVWDVEATVDQEVAMPRREVPFDSGHRYTSPMYSKSRRRWTVKVKNMDLAVYQSLLDFFNTHNGIESPFTFIVPIPDDGTAIGSTAESTESVSGWFVDDALVAKETTFEIYDVSFGVEELLVT